MHDRYGRDVLSRSNHPRTAAKLAPPPEVPAERGLVVETADGDFCGAVIRVDKGADGLAVILEDRHGTHRSFPVLPGGFLLEGRRVTLTRPAPKRPAGPTRSASGSIYVTDHRAKVAKASRIWVEGIHDAELIERVWGHDLRVEGVVVEPLHGADHLSDALAEFGPGPDRRVGVLLDHLVAGSKESRIAEEASARFSPHVEVVGHPFVDVWQAVKPEALGIRAWPEVPRGIPWKHGVIERLGWREDEAGAWKRILSRVSSYADLEPALLGRVEQLIDFVTEAP